MEIFDTATLRLAAVLKSFSKLIQSIAWHPLAEQYKGITKQDQYGMDFTLNKLNSQMTVVQRRRPKRSGV